MLHQAISVASSTNGFNGADGYVVISNNTHVLLPFDIDFLLIAFSGLVLWT